MQMKFSPNCAAGKTAFAQTAPTNKSIPLIDEIPAWPGIDQIMAKLFEIVCVFGLTHCFTLVSIGPNQNSGFAI
jgi:hypothetical protein